MPEKNTRTRGFKSQLAEILKEHAGASERRRGKAAGGLTANTPSEPAARPARTRPNEALRLMLFDSGVR